MDRFNEDISNINFYILKHLHPYARSDPIRIIRVQIKSGLYQYLRTTLKYNCRFKSGVDFIKIFNVPTTKILEPTKRCEINLSSSKIKVWQAKPKGDLTPKQSMTIKLVKNDIF